MLLALGAITLNGALTAEGRQVGQDVELDLGAGTYEIAYQPTRPYIEVLSTNTPIVTLLKNEKVVEALSETFPVIKALDEDMLMAIGNASMRELAHTPYLRLSDAQLDGIDRLLKNITGE